MSGITSGVGVFSGINRDQLISQLLSIDSRQKTVYQKRIAQLQQQQASYLDLNSKLGALKTAAAKFATSNIFNSAAAASSNESILTAAAATGATAGSYQFVVDRLVSTQQLLSAGFAQSTGVGVGLTNLTLESTDARLDRDTALANLNGGAGIVRGKIRVTDASGASAVVDLSRVESLGEVLGAINNASGIAVKARADGDRLVIQNLATGTGTLTIANVDGGSTATSLGIAGAASTSGSGGVLTGARVNTLGERTALSQLNDGLGVQINPAGGFPNPDFKITTRSGEVFEIDIGDLYEMQTPAGGGAQVAVKIKSAVTDLGGVITRINEQAVVSGQQRVRAQINATGTGIDLIDLSTPAGGSPALTVEELGGRSTARDLGILSTTTGATLNGRRLTSALNSTLLRTLLGGQGLGTNPGLNIGTTDGQNFSLDLTSVAEGSVSDLADYISAQTGGRVSVTLNREGTGLIFTDTAGGPGALDFGGSAASALGIANTDGDNVAQSANLQKQYVGLATQVSRLNNGRGIGTGAFELVNSYGKRFTVNVGSGVQTVADLISVINSSTENIRARVNDNGDGLILEALVAEGVPGGQRISVIDKSGGVAKSLNLVGTATTAVDGQNVINGSYERSIALLATDSLTEIVTKINQSGADVSAAIVNDGNASRPFRLSLASKTSGLGGAFIYSTAGADMGFTQISAPQNSRVFFGSADPASALLFSGSSNSLTGVAANLTVNLKTVSSDPVTVTVSRDVTAIEKNIEDFVKAFNELVSRIDTQSKFDSTTNKGGVLLGNSMAQTLRSSLFQTLTGPAVGVSGRFQFASQVGLTAGTSGTIKLDSTKLRQALEQDAQAVTDLLSAKVQAAATTQQEVPGVPGVLVTVSTAGAFTSQGIFERIAEAVDRYIKPVDGLFTRQTKTIDDQIKAQNARITQIDTALGRKRDRLQRQFLSMEQAIGKIQSQQGAIANIQALSF